MQNSTLWSSNLILLVIAHQEVQGEIDRASLLGIDDGDGPGVGVSPPLPSSSSASSYKPTSTFTPVEDLPPRPVQVWNWAFYKDIKQFESV